MRGHPPERSIFSRPMSRRDFLWRSAGTAFAVSSASALLAACRTRETTTTAGGLKVPFDAAPDNPRELPIFGDNPPIEDGLDPETGTLQIFNWVDYLWKRVLNDFGKEMDVDWEYTTFHNTSIALEKLATGSVDFDIFFPTPDELPKLVEAKLVQPLNLSYIPNLNADVWPELVDPYYDKGAHYSVPYTVYTTGIGWRTDFVDEDIGARDNPYEVFWDPAYKGKIGIYDDYREAMSMVMLKNGISDVNTDDPADIDTVKNDLIAMTEATNIRTTINGAYSGIPESNFWIHQAWSGDMVAAPYYMPGNDYGDPNGLLRYWYPPEGGGMIGNDLMVIPKGAPHPVLAHHFLNFMLDPKVAIKNFSWVGYQPPQNSIQPSQLVKDGYVVPNLEPAVVEPAQFDTGHIYLALAPDVEAKYQDAWTEFKAGVGE